MSCRWTERILTGGTGPDAPGLDREAERHLAGCRQCRSMVERAKRLDAALGMDLRERRTEELPRIVLASPSLPRRARGMQATTSLIAVGATLAIAAVASGIALTPPTSEPGQMGVDNSGVAGASAGASADPTADAVVLEPGRIAAVVNEPDTDVPLVVRTEPGTDDPATITAERLHAGQRVRLLDGPVEADGYPWYEVSVGEVSGWVASESKDGSSPWLEALGNGEILYTAADANGTLRVVSPKDGSSRDFLPQPLANIDLVISCGPIASGTWSSDGDFAVIVDGPSCLEASVYRVNADGTGPVHLGDGLQPEPSWAGDRVAFTPIVPYLPCGIGCGSDGDAGPWDVLVAPADGTAPATPITSSEPGFAASGIGWSPDGRQIVFSGQRIGDPSSGEIVAEQSVFRYDGEAVVRLAAGFGPRWSPDGRWIVFGRSDESGAASNLFRMRADGSDEQPLGPGDPTSVRFSPDGRSIVFTTSGTVAVAAFAAPYTVTARLGEGAEPSWAPDGEYVTWNRLDETADSSGITIARSDGSDAHTLVPGSGPSWRPIIGQAEAP